MNRQPIRVEISIDSVRAVYPLAKHAAATLLNVAPERRDELVAAAHDLVIRLTDQGTWSFHVNLADRSIELSRKAVEYLWASAYAYFVLYDEYYRREHARESMHEDISQVPRVREALNLLQRVLEDVLTGADRPWIGPKPLVGGADGSDEGAADELCLVALGFLLHHEFAHRRLGHGRSAIEEEQDADLEAVRWLLDSVQLLSNKEVKRSLGVGVGMAALVAIGIHTGNHGGMTHPYDFNRLFNTMDLYLGNVPEHTAWLLVSVALKLHLDNNGRGLSAPAREFETPREAVYAYVDLIAEANRAEGHA